MKNPAAIVLGVGNIGKRVVELLAKQRVGVLGLGGSSTFLSYARPVTTGTDKLLQRFADVKKDKAKQMNQVGLVVVVVVKKRKKKTNNTNEYIVLLLLLLFLLSSPRRRI